MMSETQVKDLTYWKSNAEEDYMKVPISVLRYISELEQEVEILYSKEDMEKTFNVGFSVGYNDEESPSYLTFEEWITKLKKN